MPYKDPVISRIKAAERGAKRRRLKLEDIRAYDREWKKRWRAKHKEEAHQYAQSYRCANPEKMKQYYTDNYKRIKADPVRLQKHREARTAYKKAHPPEPLTPEKKREYNQRAYYKHRAKILAQKKSIYVPRPRRKKDAEGAKLWKREYHAKRKGAPGTCTPDQWRARIAYYGNCCAYCWIELTLDTVTVDHIKPTVAGGSNWPSNLAPACLTCNRKKNRRRWIPRPVWQKES